jgi:hypothetical protein
MEKNLYNLLIYDCCVLISVFLLLSVTPLKAVSNDIHIEKMRKQKLLQKSDPAQQTKKLRQKLTQQNKDFTAFQDSNSEKLTPSENSQHFFTNLQIDANNCSAISNSNLEPTRKLLDKALQTGDVQQARKLANIINKSDNKKNKINQWKLYLAILFFLIGFWQVISTYRLYKKQ